MIKKRNLLNMLFWNWKALDHFYNMLIRGYSWKWAYRETNRLRKINYFKNV